jgi:Uncharacterised protein family UPF0547
MFISSEDHGDDMSTNAMLVWIFILSIVVVIAVVRERRRQAAERALPPAPPVGVVVTGPNHLLHLVLTVLTCGVWGVVWLVVALNEKREIHVVDAYGRIVDSESVAPTIAAQPPAEETVARVLDASDAPAVAKAATKKCPDCAESILADANVCKHCGYRFAPAAPSSAPSPAPKPKTVQSTPPTTASQPGESEVRAQAASADAQAGAEAAAKEAQARAEAARARANELRRRAEE